MWISVLLMCSLTTLSLGNPSPPPGGFLLGAGIADMTGPAAEINLMGYAKLGQDSTGIHLRQFSRAFIFSDGDKRMVYVSCDIGMTTQLLKIEVVKSLQKKYGDLYTADNVCISSTHTHSGPAGFFQYFVYLITSSGFIRQTLDAYVTGIVKSVERAHDSLQPGYVLWSKGELLDSSINRSPTAYLNNTASERSRYSHNTDKEMLLLKLVDVRGRPVGMINWFAVHGTSMNNTNTLISSDNKGYASVLFEQEMNGKHAPVGKGPFVAAFAQTNEGDVSPNTRGPHCQDTGQPCDIQTSTCNGDATKCVASGPGRDMFESTKIIAEKQLLKAKELFQSATAKISGTIDWAHQYVDMTSYPVRLRDNSTVNTCKGALGYSFAAGTTDGPGVFPFSQHTNQTSPIWDLVRDLIHKPSEQLVECQRPKPILLAVGEIDKPYDWVPAIVPTQILRLGSLLIAAVPGEFTTMSGRRLREAVQKEMARWNQTVQVVISGLSNTYTNYITTFEEYQVQRYEGASTLYGPHTLEAYIQQFTKLAEALASSGPPLPPGPSPPDLLDKQISFKPGVLFDMHPLGKPFGSVIVDVKPQYRRENGTVVLVTFVSANPRNNLQLEDTFLTVERMASSGGAWEVVATDANWETKFRWYRLHAILEPAVSYADVTWEVPADTKPGKYRIRHRGYRRTLLQSVNPFSGVSSTFRILPD